MPWQSLYFPVLNIHPMIRHKLAFFIPTIWAELARIATPGLWLLLAAIYTLYVWIFNSRDFVYDGHYFNKGKKIEFNWENEDI